MDRTALIVGLLENGTVRATAKALNVSPNTIYLGMKEDGFKEDYDRAKQQVLSEVCNKLVSNLLLAVDTTSEIMENADNSPQVRLNASQILFNVAIRLTEQCDVLARIEKLEEIEKERADR